MSKTQNQKPEAKNETGEKKKAWFLDRRYRGIMETIVFLIIAIVFFIINNTRKEPEHGPYPPSYAPDTTITIAQ